MSSEKRPVAANQLRKEFCGHQPERAADSDLDSPDRHAAVEMDAPSLQGEVVFFQSGFHAAFEPVHLPGSPPLVGEPLRHAAAGPTGRTAEPGSELIRTGQLTISADKGRQLRLAACPPHNDCGINPVLIRTVWLLDLSLIHISEP